MLGNHIGNDSSRAGPVARGRAKRLTVHLLTETVSLEYSCDSLQFHADKYKRNGLQRKTPPSRKGAKGKVAPRPHQYHECGLGYRPQGALCGEAD